MKKPQNPASDENIRDVERNAQQKDQAPVREGTEQSSIQADVNPVSKKDYPRPTEADRQYKNQPEYIHRNNNDMDEG